MVAIGGGNAIRPFFFMAITAATALIAVGARAGCALFPPPFSISAGEAAEFFDLSPRVAPERGYWEIPVFKKECSELSESIAVVAAFYDGKPAALTFSGTVVGQKGLEGFNGFVKKYVGDPADAKEGDAIVKSNDMRRAEWKKRGYGARYVVFPAGAEAKGMYRVNLRLVSDAFAAVAARHYDNEEGEGRTEAEDF